MSRASQDGSCHEHFFLTTKDRLTGIKLNYKFNSEMSFWMFIKDVTRALLTESSRLIGPGRLHVNSH